ncbi:MAG TPA: hypothetical protein VHT24_02635 [Pseudacidobacterium sp.]|nr:hypothetical protein [Pseudacidobacterium sp.]
MRRLVPDLGRGHVALGQKVTTQAVGDLTGIHPVILLLGCRNRSQHQRMCYLHLFRMRKQIIVDPAGEDRRFHGDRPGLGKCPDPRV